MCLRLCVKLKPNKWRMPHSPLQRIPPEEARLKETGKLIKRLHERRLKKESQSVTQFSHSVTSHSLRPHESQHTTPPCQSQTPGVYSSTHPLSRWCHPAISPSVILFSSCPQPLRASGSFPTSPLFAWGGQSIGVSASASVLPMNTQDWSALGWTGWSPCSPRDSQK